MQKQTQKQMTESCFYQRFTLLFVRFNVAFDKFRSFKCNLKHKI